MTRSDNAPPLDRRSFLRGIGLAVAAPAATLVAAPAAEAAPETAATGYQETEHVRRAYEAARF